MSLVLNGTDNSVSGPAVTGSTGGTGTGLYYPTTNQVALSTNGTQALLINASQQVTLANDASISGLTVGKGGGNETNTTVLGSGAVAASNSGGYLTAVGKNALAANTSGVANDAFGYGALTTNTTGSNNAGFGIQTLNFNTTGGNNVAVGRQALYLNTTASNNTAVGYQAGQAITTATANACFGAFSGFSLTSGSTVGGYNAFIGRYAGYSSTTDLNTFVGNAAGYLITTGSRNTLLGGFSGNQGGLDIRTASNYIVLSDGDGNPRGVFNGNGQYLVNATSPISSGQVGVIAGSSNNGLEVKVTNNGYAPFVGYNSSGSLIFYADGGGTIHAVSTSITAISDQKLKTNIKTIKYGLDTVNQLKPVTFDFIKNDLVNGETGKLGFIAQDVESVIPELVADGLNKSENGTPYKTLNMGDMLPVLVKAVQELNAKVTELEVQLGAK